MHYHLPVAGRKCHKRAGFRRQLYYLPAYQCDIHLAKTIIEIQISTLTVTTKKGAAKVVCSVLLLTGLEVDAVFVHEELAEAEGGDATVVAAQENVVLDNDYLFE